MRSAWLQCAIDSFTNAMTSEHSIGKFAPTYEGPYVVKKGFFGGALILVDMDGHAFNMPINSDVVIRYFVWKSLVVHLIFTFYFKKKKKKNNT